MTGDSLVHSEDVTRLVGGSKICPKTGKIDFSAFDRTAKDTTGLSFNRTGVFSPDQDADDAEISRIMRSRLSVGKTAVHAVTNVGTALKALASFGTLFDFVENPLDAEVDKPANPAHVLMKGLPFVGEAIGSLNSDVAGALLCRTISRTFLAWPPKARIET